ncbi:MAG: prepilin-type N-terminal cleavage/methylation domain-containing protein [Longimicrobiales bacterium]|nr:prepilin-type N-terminal cleavage/methylation domain-containing protein [Longimicrobiales bacterium]
MDLQRKGFTLIELHIVVVIIGILASIAIPKFGAVREKAYLAASRADLRNLANLQDVYYNDNYTYTTSLAALAFTNTEGVAVTIGEATNLGWSATASHAGLPTESCGIYHGGAAQVAPATTVSVVQCSI